MLLSATKPLLLNLQGGLAGKFKQWELLALVLAAAGHDVGHKGKAFNPAVVLSQH
jgi:hypothetical protein